jgi:hypothetical protein
MKGATPSAEDELAVLQRAMRRCHREDPETGRCATCDATVEFYERKRPRHSGGNVGAETRARLGGEGGPEARSNPEN